MCTRTARLPPPLLHDHHSLCCPRDSYFDGFYQAFPAVNSLVDMYARAIDQMSGSDSDSGDVHAVGPDS